MRTYAVYIWQIEGVALENCMGMGRYGAKLVNICHRSVVEKIPEDREMIDNMVTRRKRSDISVSVS